MKQHYWETRETLNPHKALDYLKEGNQRFMSNLRINRNFLELVNETAEKQFPFATILSCSDSRMANELVFDQGLGDLFVIRLAGNIASLNAIGSMEYACKYLGSKLIVVLGHTNCGAVKGACDGLEDGHITQLLRTYIQPAVDAEVDTLTNRTSENKSFVNNVAHLNILYQMQVILDNSTIIRDMIAREEIGIVGGIYDVTTGKITFYDDENIFDLSHSVEKLKKHFMYDQ
jgi:carbonic anhydrase